MSIVRTETPLPAAIVRAISLANRAPGWTAELRDRSVLITPPGAKRGISLSRRGNVVTSYVNKQLEDAGLLKAIEEIEAAERATRLEAGSQEYADQLNDNQPEVEPAEETAVAEEPEPTEETTVADATPAAEFHCPECDYVAQSPAGLGAHRRTHGVVGATKKASAAKASDSRLDGVQAALRLVQEELDAVRSTPVDDSDTVAKLKRQVEDLKGQLAEERKASRKVPDLTGSLKELKKELRDHENFRARAEKAIMEESPVQAVVAIVKAGGHGFARTKPGS